MNLEPTLGFSAHLTHKANLKHTRYGWLRLTPAYSVHLVSDILNTHQEKKPIVLDPFCGTGTTALVCAENGVESDTTDINPFLIWLTQVKTRSYSEDHIAQFNQCALDVKKAILASGCPISWVPPLYQIEKWWDEHTLSALSRAISVINSSSINNSEIVRDLLKIAFCRVMIEQSSASFGHQSMSFKKSDNALVISSGRAETEVAEGWAKAVLAISHSACSSVRSGTRAILCDARNLSEQFPDEHFSCVITSPPYPNRMSYIRELRPYMYWLRYLETGREAGELDWKAIGGTWGCATSNVGKWNPETTSQIPYPGFYEILDSIAETSPLLSRYVHKYFYDMMLHVEELYQVMKQGGKSHYIVGNSKFYDVMLPVEEIFASLFRAAGFDRVNVSTLRKRTSKKELFEYMVSASKPKKIISKIANP
jgi:predicted methyltransferase